LGFYRDFSLAAPDELRLDAVLGTSPIGPSVAIIGCWCGLIDQGNGALARLRALGTPALASIAQGTNQPLQTLLQSLRYETGQLHSWKGSFFREVTDRAIDAMVRWIRAAPTPVWAVAIEHMGGAVSRVPVSDTAFSHRLAQHSFLAIGVATDA